MSQCIPSIQAKWILVCTITQNLKILRSKILDPTQSHQMMTHQSPMKFTPIIHKRIITIIMIALTIIITQLLS